MELMETSYNSNAAEAGKKNQISELLFHTSSYYCSSPSAKKPNVVARPMGLDLVPDDLDLSRSSRNRVRGHRLTGKGSGTR